MASRPLSNKLSNTWCSWVTSPRMAGKSLRAIDAQLDTLGERAPGHALHLDEQRPELDRQPVAFGAPGEGEELFHQVCAAPGAAFDEVEIVHRAVWQRQPQQFGGHENRGERVVEVVRDPTGQRADALHPLGAPQLGLQSLLFGDIPLDGNEADRLPCGVTHWRNGDLFVVERAVLPLVGQAPAPDLAVGQHASTSAGRSPRHAYRS